MSTTHTNKDVVIERKTSFLLSTSANSSVQSFQKNMDNSGSSITTCSGSTLVEDDAHSDEHSCNVFDDTEVTLIGDVVGAYDINCDDSPENSQKTGFNQPSNICDTKLLGWKPYAEVYFGQTKIHRTGESAETGRHPTWTLSTRSLFSLVVTPQKLCEDKTGLSVSIWYRRKDPLQLTTLEKCFLGKAVLDFQNILNHCNEERLEVDLWDHDYFYGDEKCYDTLNRARHTSRGKVILRFRLAAPCDIPFLNFYHKRPDLMNQTGNELLYKLISSKALTMEPTSMQISSMSQSMPSTVSPCQIAPILTEVDEASVVQESFVKAVTTVFSSNSIVDRATGERKFRVKPHADPDCIEDTTYLSCHQIKAKTLSPSKEWIAAGSGALGKMYLEILSCSDLPQKDIGEAVGNVTDCFICAVFEDAMVQTCVVYDELNPHWLPWTNRAFCFGLKNPTSPLYLAAFDFDLGLSDHEPIGRAVVNIGNLQRNIEYTLKYNLYHRSSVTEREQAGAITIRIRIEYKDEKKALLAAVTERKDFYVNVKKEKSLPVVHYTCFGRYGDNENFDLNSVKLYVRELLGYKNTFSYIFFDSLESLVLWKGQVRLFNVMTPLHSFLLFCFSAILVERPRWTPSFFFFSISWFMLAMHAHRRQHPSPWSRCPSFWHYISVLRYGSSPLSTCEIDADQNAEEVLFFQQALDKAWADRLEKDERIAAKKADLEAQVQALDEAIYTKVGATLPIELLARLSRYQAILARLCRYCRFVKLVVTWEESLLSFWLTAIFLAAGMISLIIPWQFLSLWIGRFIVWGLLGPHMKFVDIMFFADAAVEGDKGEKVIQLAIEHYKEKSRSARLRRQDTIRLKDMKSLTFGAYSTLVPPFNLSGHVDRPLSVSSAKTYFVSNDTVTYKMSSMHVPGQQFQNGIIPRTELGASLFQAEQYHLQNTLLSLKDRFKVLQTTSMEVGCVDDSLCSDDANLPESIGYELINYSDCGISSKTIGEPQFGRISSVVWNCNSGKNVPQINDAFTDWRLPYTINTSTLDVSTFIEKKRTEVKEFSQFCHAYAIKQDKPLDPVSMVVSVVNPLEELFKLDPMVALDNRPSKAPKNPNDLTEAFDLDALEERVEVILTVEDDELNSDQGNYDEISIDSEVNNSISFQEQTGLVYVLQYVPFRQQ